MSMFFSSKRRQRPGQKALDLAETGCPRHGVMQFRLGWLCWILVVTACREVNKQVKLMLAGCVCEEPCSQVWIDIPAALWQHILGRRTVGAVRKTYWHTVTMQS